MIADVLAEPEVRPAAARAALLLVVVIALPGIATAAGAGHTLFDLDAERTLPATVSGAVLAFAACIALLVGRALRSPGRLAAYGLAVLFGFMALDEIAELHERLERALAVDWQVLYAPLAMVGGIGFVVLLALARSLRAEQLLLVAGAGAWVAAQILERLEWGGGTQSAAAYSARLAETDYKAMAVVEEILELAGSACFALGLLALLAAVRARPQVAVLAEGEVAHDAPVDGGEGADAQRRAEHPLGTPVAQGSERFLA